MSSCPFCRAPAPSSRTVTTYPIDRHPRSTLARYRLSQAPCGHIACSQAGCAPPLRPSTTNNAVHTIIRRCKARRVAQSGARLAALLLRHARFSSMRPGTGVAAPGLNFRPSLTCVGRRVSPKRDRQQHASVKTSRAYQAWRSKGIVSCIDTDSM